MEKKEFLHSELWLLTIGAAFQRARVYDKEAAKKDRPLLRDGLRKHIDPLVSAHYLNGEVDDVQHLENIRSVCHWSGQHGGVLRGGKLNFGITQKLLNLYLKYLWCVGEIPPPPHFPVDRIIQKKLQPGKLTAWTQMNDPDVYLAIINKAREKAKAEKITLSEWELTHFSRNNNRKKELPHAKH